MSDAQSQFREAKRSAGLIPPAVAPQIAEQIGAGSKPKPDTDAMVQALGILAPDGVVELRALFRRKRTDAGYFDAEHHLKLAQAAEQLNAQGAAVYVTLNPVDQQLLGRTSNRIEQYAQDTTTDANIIRRKWVLLDFDPVRPKDTSSTDAQLDGAKELTRACYKALRESGWPDPIAAESGNGMHLLYPIDLPNDAEVTAAIKGALNALADRFDTDAVKVDRSVFNAARITKLYGTVANKGDNTPAMPWRLSRIVKAPKREGVVTLEQLQALAPVAEPPKRINGSAGPLRELDLDAFFSRLGIAYQQDQHDGADRFKLDTCPFNPEHVKGEAAIFRWASGKLGFKCQHNSCADKNWQDVRALVDGPPETRRTHASAPAMGESQPVPGERGERGETPRQSTIPRGRTPGESGRIMVESARAEAMKRALALLSGAEHVGQAYPVDALGPLAEPCKAIVEGGQIATDMAGQCLLGAAALLTQSKANVRTLAGIKPLSLNLQTIGESGDGKSSTDDVALNPMRQWQRVEGTRYRAALELFEREAAKRKKGDPKVEMEREPYLVMRDGTVEGIRRAFKQGLPSQGVFTSEAAAMIAGYGMNPDNRMKSAGNFNALWDDGEISVARGLDGRVQLYDRRLSLHWMIQPDVARSALHDPLLSSIGFWPRFLLSWSPPSAPRTAKPFRPERDRRITDYWTRCTELLNHRLADDCKDLPEIAPTDEAMRIACGFFELMEKGAKTAGGIYESVKPFAVRATEQMFRIAGVLASFDKKKEIDAEAMKNAAKLALHSLNTWRAVYGDRDEADARASAIALYLWMLKQPWIEATETAILRIGPKSLRSQSRRDTSLALLEQAGLAQRERDKWYAVVKD